MPDFAVSKSYPLKSSVVKPNVGTPSMAKTDASVPPMRVGRLRGSRTFTSKDSPDGFFGWVR